MPRDPLDPLIYRILSSFLVNIYKIYKKYFLVTGFLVLNKKNINSKHVSTGVEPRGGNIGTIQASFSGKKSKGSHSL